jgi:hypothetical protein
MATNLVHPQTAVTRWYSRKGEIWTNAGNKTEVKRVVHKAGKQPDRFAATLTRAHRTENEQTELTHYDCGLVLPVREFSSILLAAASPYERSSNCGRTPTPDSPILQRAGSYPRLNRRLD